MRLTFETLAHLVSKPLLEVGFPVRVEWIGGGFGFDVSSDGDLCGLKKHHLMCLPLIVGYVTEEVPFAALVRAEVLAFNPGIRFIVMTTFSPTPQCLPEVIVEIIKGLLTDDVVMVVGPTANDRIE